MSKRVVALLPMKANSERVRGKNFLDLAGKPLFRWILDELLAVDTIDKIVINTDAREVLEYHGLKETDRIMIRDRKSELRGDMVSMNRIIADDIDAVAADLYLMTHTTNPLISSKTIIESLAKFDSAADRDSLFTVNKVQTRFYDINGTPINHDPDNLIRTQDLEPWFEENSCIYIFSRYSFAKTNARIGERPMLMVTPPLESLEIDDPHDWDTVSALAHYRKTNV